MPRPDPESQFDSADLDAILDLERSPGYALVKARVEEQLETRRVRLEQDCDLPLTAYTRGYIAALRMVLDVPSICKEEIKAQL